MRVEEGIQMQIFNWLAHEHPNVIAISEPSGLRVSQGLAMKLKRLRSKHVHLDLYLLEPRGKFSGLVIELKAKNIYKKDGTLLKNEHLQDQQNTIELLKEKGYYATFAVGFEECKNIITDYLNGNI